MTIIRWLLISGVCIYALFVGMLYVMQRSLLYHPTALRIPPAEAGMPEAQEVELDTSDGEKLVAWHVPPRDDMPVVIYFHGNGEIVQWRIGHHRALIRDGVGLIAVNFRGYAARPARRPRTACIATPRLPMRSLRRAIRPSASCCMACRSAPASR
jgi:hypothetical protein